VYRTSGSRPTCRKPNLQPDLLTPSFDYNVVDGLGRAWQRGHPPRMDGLLFRAGAIGPLIEVACLGSAEKLREIRQNRWLNDGSHELLLDAFLAKRRQWRAGDHRQGVATGAALEDAETVRSFKMDAHMAAKNAGFGSQAGYLVAALGEIIGNAIDHSQFPTSAVALFSSGRGEFEFVVADQGIGVLESLTQNPELSSLSDYGEALEAMTEAGVSRFARSTGHGNGFRPIFEKLADMTGELRFRSGDYALTLDGRFGDKIARQIVQKPKMQGFLAAVTCRVQPHLLR